MLHEIKYTISCFTYTDDLYDDGVDPEDRKAVLEYAQRNAAAWFEEIHDCHTGDEVEIEITEAKYSLKRFTKSIAEKYIDDPASVDLSEFNLIDDDAAKVLSEMQNEAELMFESVLEISDITAEVLSKHNGWVRLWNVDDLSVEAAKSFGCHHHRELQLGIKELDSKVANELKNHKGLLFLKQITRISDDVAEIMSGYKGEQLELSGLQELSDTAAKSFSKFTGETFWVGEVKMSEAAAKAFSEMPAKEINELPPKEWLEQYLS